MALIVEVLDERDGSVRSRVRVDSLPLRLGRGWDNDVILDDAYVDAHHARIAPADGGGFVIEDLGSVNGLVLMADSNGGDGRREIVVAAGGVKVRLGRTIVRFRDPAEPLPPALPERLAGNAAPGTTGTPVRATTLTGASAGDSESAAPPSHASTSPFTRLRWRIALPLAACAIVLLDSWLSSFNRNTTSEAVTMVLGFAIIASIWAGIWAVGARIVIGRFHFTAHLAVTAGAMVAAFAFVELDEWLRFIIPGVGASNPFNTGVSAALIGALVAAHLGLASTMNRARQWRAGAIVAGVIVGITAITALVADDSFTDVPTFNGALRPAVVRWPAPHDPQSFGESLAPLRTRVDARVTPPPTSPAEQP